MLPWLSATHFQYLPRLSLRGYLICRPFECRIRCKGMATTPLVPYNSNPHLPGVGRRQLHDNTESDLPNGAQISDIVMGTQNSGVNVNRNGELEIISEGPSHRHHKTALILSRASPSLTEYDIRRVLEYQNDDPEGAMHKGLEEVFPLRQYQTLQRRDSWVLIFTTPAHAKKYQQTMLQLRHAYSNTPPFPDSTAINTAPGLLSQGRRNRIKMHSYPLITPSQRLSLVAKLFPFDPKLQRAIGVYKGLVQPKAIDQWSFPVRLYLPFSGYLSAAYIKKLLQLDGVARGRPWAVSSDDDAIVQVGPDIVSKFSQMSSRDSSAQSSAIMTDNWRINFVLASDAAQFVRTWHRRPFPRLDDSKDCRSLILKAECLFG